MFLFLLALIVTGHVLILSRLIFFPYPELFIYPYLTKIGLIPYRDIFDQHFPGIMFFPINLASLGIDTPDEMRVVQYTLVGITHLVLYLVSNQIFKSSKKALFVNLIYLIWQPFFEGYVLWIDSFATPLLLTSFYFLVKDDRKINFNLFVSGFVIGIALLFKQVVLPLSVITAIYIWREFRNLKQPEKYIAGVAIPGFILMFFVYFKGIPGDFWYWTVTYNLTVFAAQGRKYPGVSELLKSLVFFGPAIFTVFYFLIKQKLDRILALLAIYLLGALVFAYARFDYVHLQPGIPYTALLISYFIFKFHEKSKYLLGSAFIFLSLTFVIWFGRGHIGSSVLFYGEDERKITEKVNNYSDEGDSVFAFGTFPHLYQMTETAPPGRVFVFQFPWFMVKAENSILDGIKSDPPRVVVRDVNSEVNGINLVKFMSKIHKHIGQYYKTVDTVGNVEIMIPN
jgi:hypothetical protein